MNFGEVLKNLREEADMTQEELAREIGVNRSSIAGYEAMGKKPEFDTFLKIANYFKISTDYLLGRTDKKILDTDLMILFDNEPKVESFFHKLLKIPEYKQLVILSEGMSIKDMEKLCQLIKILFDQNIKG